MNLALPHSAPESLLLGRELRRKERQSGAGPRGPRKAWRTHVLDYRSFLCLYSNKWHSLYCVGRLDSLTVDENKYCMWFTLSCQCQGRARDGEMRTATLLLLLSQLSHLDDSPPLCCSLFLSPPPATPESFLSSSHFGWVTAQLPWVQNYFGRGILERVIVLFSPPSFSSFVANCERATLRLW